MWDYQKPIEESIFPLEMMGGPISVYFDGELQLQFIFFPHVSQSCSPSKKQETKRDMAGKENTLGISLTYCVK